ncbi:MAG: hypothetical protein ACJ759_04415, partial [Thermoanaerobaculia bacterium]
AEAPTTADADDGWLAQLNRTPSLLRGGEYLSDEQQRLFDEFFDRYWDLVESIGDFADWTKGQYFGVRWDAEMSHADYPSSSSLYPGGRAA